MNNMYILITIIISTTCTFALRALPFLVAGRMKEKSNKRDFLGRILPPAIMAVLLVYCLKDVPDSFYEIGIPKFVGVLITGISYIWKHNTFLSIIVGTIGYMIMIQII